MNNHLIHAQQDGLVDWSYEVFLQVVSPTPLLRSAVHRLLLFTDHQGGQVFCSVHNSGEEATTALVSSEVDKRQDM